MLSVGRWLAAIPLAIAFSLAPLGGPQTTLAGTKDDQAGSGWQSDAVDQDWASRALADPEADEGWTQPCSDEWSDGRVSHCEVRELAYQVGKNPIAIRGGQNGGMTIMAWDRDEVRIVYRVLARGRTREEAKALVSQIDVGVAKGWIRPTGPTESRRGWWAVEIKAWVPRSSDLALETHNGPAAVRGVRGRMNIKSVNGPVSLVDLGGAVIARVQNGPLHVALHGERWVGAGLDAEAQNGPVNLIVPRKYSAWLQTGTIHGPTSFDYAIERHRSGHLTVTLGQGGPPVRVVTSNGPFTISER